ncbi:hypothetical protein [Ideonella livida]|uniref:Esterase n=1 Tax=Ideonella livida TaxID=2707176 RepID=A0A7C9PGK5_9BURK|nr:hypothetical protein [Ideonella livida]NDY91149.1 hypothetical protein [Ideonella livida]
MSSFLSRRALGLGGLLLSLVLALAACGGSVSRLDPFVAERMIVFGDELSLLDDGLSTGNASQYGLNAVSSADSATISCNDNGGGRRRLWVQALADYYGLVFAPCNPSGLRASQLKAFMRAGYGATVASVALQIKGFREDLYGGFGAQDMVTVLAGLHDVMQVYGDNDSYPNDAAKLAEVRARGEQLGALVNGIIDEGPRVIVSQILDVGLTPYAQSLGNAEAKRLTALTNAFNDGLRLTVRNDGTKIGLVEMDTIARSAHQNSAYNHVDLACDEDHRSNPEEALTGADQGGSLLGCTTQTLTSDGAATTHLWADALHPNVYMISYTLGLAAVSRARNNPF